MSISQRMANPHERPQQLDHSYRIGGSGRAVLVVGARRLAERAPLDESHGVIRRLGFAQLVDRHDSRMLELSGDPGFGQKPGTNIEIAGLVGTKLFERDLPPERCVMSQPDLAHPSLGVQVRECVPLATIAFPGAERFDQHMSCRRTRRMTLGLDCRLDLRHFAEHFQAPSIDVSRQCGFHIAAVRLQFFRPERIPARSSARPSANPDQPVDQPVESPPPHSGPRMFHPADRRRAPPSGMQPSRKEDRGWCP